MRHKTSLKLFSSKSAKTSDRRRADAQNAERNDTVKTWEMSSDEALRVNYVDTISSPTMH